MSSGHESCHAKTRLNTFCHCHAKAGPLLIWHQLRIPRGSWHNYSHSNLFAFKLVRISYRKAYAGVPCPISIPHPKWKCVNTYVYTPNRNRNKLRTSMPRSPWSVELYCLYYAVFTDDIKMTKGVQAGFLVCNSSCPKTLSAALFEYIVIYYTP